MAVTLHTCPFVPGLTLASNQALDVSHLTRPQQPKHGDAALPGMQLHAGRALAVGCLGSCRLTREERPRWSARAIVYPPVASSGAPWTLSPYPHPSTRTPTLDY